MTEKAERKKASVVGGASQNAGEGSIVQKTLDDILEYRKDGVQKQVNPELETSQGKLRDELFMMCNEMDALSQKVEAIGVDEKTKTMIRECKESLFRTRKTLTTVSARVGRLSKFEEANKLKRKSDG